MWKKKIKMFALINAIFFFTSNLNKVESKTFYKECCEGSSKTEPKSRWQAGVEEKDLN